MKSIPISTIQEKVLGWYEKHGRHDLPWRNLPFGKPETAYRVLVSEFMLQQTQVERVISKYDAFLGEFSTIFALAQSDSAQVISLWSGLGYNRRAILLHRAAQFAVAEWNGILPDDPDILQRMPGIGPYTAAAIASFVYNKPVVVLDTNILRFYELLFWGHERPSSLEQTAFLQAFVPEKRSAEWHGALMDLISGIRKNRSTKAQQEALLDTLSLIQSWTLPEVSHHPLMRPKQSTFVHSLRYYRGRIIAHLTKQPNHAADLDEIAQLMQSYHMPETYDLTELLNQLRKDGLIHYFDPINPTSIISL